MSGKTLIASLSLVVAMGLSGVLMAQNAPAQANRPVTSTAPTAAPVQGSDPTAPISLPTAADIQSAQAEAAQTSGGSLEPNVQTGAPPHTPSQPYTQQ